MILISIRVFFQNEVSSIEEATNKELISVRNTIKPNKINNYFFLMNIILINLLLAYQEMNILIKMNII